MHDLVVDNSCSARRLSHVCGRVNTRGLVLVTPLHHVTAAAAAAAHCVPPLALKTHSHQARLRPSTGVDALGVNGSLLLSRAFIRLLGKLFNVIGVKTFHAYITTAKFCQCLIYTYITDKRKSLFLKKIGTCHNSIVRSFSIMSTYGYGKIMSKYSVHNRC